MDKLSIAVIGMGPAGAMSAISAAQHGAEVTIYDKNEKLGKKLYITGKGRCNLTNDCTQMEFFEAIKRNPKFFYSSYSHLSPQGLMDFFQDGGLPLKVERGRRVFPQSDKSSDVIRFLNGKLRELRVKQLFKQEVVSVLYNEQDKVFEVKTSDATQTYDRVIIACGGLSYETTGSTGDGYRFAKSFGHRIKDTYPSLVPIILKDIWIREVEGLSLKYIELTLKIKKKKYVEFGDLVFTNNGISGPVVLTLSSYLGGLKTNDVDLSLDWKPALSADELYQRIIRERDKGPNRLFQTLLETLLPKSMVPVFADQINIGLRTPINELTKANQEDLVRLLKSFPLTYKSLGEFKQAVVTQGGVDVREINPSSMESKIQKGLYFAGEVIDIDALTGGYNLQLAFSTGYLAGLSAAVDNTKELE